MLFSIPLETLFIQFPSFFSAFFPASGFPFQAAMVLYFPGPGKLLGSSFFDFLKRSPGAPQVFILEDDLSLSFCVSSNFAKVPKLTAWGL